MTTPISSGESGADSLWHEIAMWLLKFLTLCGSCDHFLTEKGPDVGPVLAARDRAGYRDGDSMEPHGGGWEFTKEKEDEGSSAVGTVLIMAYKALLDMTFVNFMSFHCAQPPG